MSERNPAIPVGNGLGTFVGWPHDEAGENWSDCATSIGIWCGSRCPSSNPKYASFEA